MTPACLIIAAGAGSRIAERGSPKPLIPLLGLPLIERVIMTARGAGATDFYVVTGYQGDRVREFLDTLAARRDVTIHHIFNGEWEAGNGLSVLKAKKNSPRPIFSPDGGSSLQRIDPSRSATEAGRRRRSRAGGRSAPRIQSSRRSGRRDQGAGERRPNHRYRQGSFAVYRVRYRDLPLLARPLRRPRGEHQARGLFALRGDSSACRDGQGKDVRHQRRFLDRCR